MRDSPREPSDLSRRNLLRGGAAAFLAAGLPMARPPIGRGPVGSLLSRLPAHAPTRFRAAPLRQSEYAPYVNTAFRFLVDRETVQTTLTGVVTRTKASVNGEAFSLEFSAPPSTALTQGTYTVSHDKLGQFSLFVVPVDRPASGQTYEAAFNRL